VDRVVRLAHSAALSVLKVHSDDFHTQYSKPSHESSYGTDKFAEAH